MELSKSQPVIDVNESPTGVYIGSDIIEGYAKLRPEEMDIPPKRRDAMDAAINMANRAAVDKAYRLSQVGSKPTCETGIVVLSIRISPPKVDKPYTEAIPAILLPPEASVFVRGLRPEDKYVILSVSVMWTARWICLPAGGIEGLPRDTVTASNAKTHVGDKVFDFGCPQPSFDRVVVFENNQVHHELVKYPVAKFRADYPNFINSVTSNLTQQTFSQLYDAILKLPKCPAECPETQLSITLGYPEPFSVVAEEGSVTKTRNEYVRNPEFKLVEVPYEVLSYNVKGKWSWSVQRTCCSD